MREVCRQNGILGGAGGASKARRPAVCTPEGLHVLALRTEHASGRSVVRTRAVTMESSVITAPERCAERAGAASDRVGRQEPVLPATNPEINGGSTNER